MWIFSKQQTSPEPDMKEMAEFMSTFDEWKKKKAEADKKKPAKVFTWGEATKIRLLLFPAYGAFFFYLGTGFLYYNAWWLKEVVEQFK